MVSESNQSAALPRAPYTYNLAQAFYRIVRARGNATALRFPHGETVSFKELNRLSNRMARAFRAAGARRGDVICILNNKSSRAFAAMLACLKIGAPYVNLDVTSPPERVEKMLDTCAPALLLLDGAQRPVRPGGAGFDIASFDLASPEFSKLTERQQAEDLPESAEITGADPAYIMFTSGSTGFPKGAVMSHGNVLNFIGWARETFAVSQGDVFTNVNPIYFDNSVFDFYASLFSGATLCPFGARFLTEPLNLVRAVNDLECTVWFSVPSLLVYLLTLRALGPDDFSSVTRVIFGGEGFPKNKLRELYRRIGDRTRLINVYGPTECTCICSAYAISREEAEDQSRLAPLGRMAPNFGFRIDPVSGDPSFGELLISGPNVGLGYFNDPGRTEKAFIQDPGESRYNRIVYRTGDLVHADEDGTLHFRGRADNQIKHMGHRIELEEIE
ncbi:MAG: amino acid adenylation domain-containing protein, partial [Alphaproteobacteria bacterium]